MKLPLLLLPVVFSGVIVCHAESIPPEASKDPFAQNHVGTDNPVPVLGSGFADFCRENPSAPVPVGDKPVWLEYFIGEVEADQAVVNVKAAEMVTQGKGEWGFIEARTNSSASGGSVYTMERAPDGRLLETNERREIGTSIYLHVFPGSGGGVALQVKGTKFEQWVEVGGARTKLQPIYSSREIATNLTLGTEWIRLGVLSREQVTRQADGTEQVKKVSSLIFCRLLSEKPVSAPQTITVAIQMPQVLLPKLR